MRPGGGGGGGGVKGQATRLGPDEEVYGQAFDARLMKRLVAYLKPYGLQTALAVVLLLSFTGVEMAGPLLIKIGIDRHIAVGRLEGLDKVALAFVGLLAVGFVLRYWQTYLMQWIGQRVVLDLRTRLFNHLQRQDIKFIDSRQVGWLMTRLTSDIQTLNEMFTSAIVSVFGDLFALAVIVVILCLMNLKLALVTFVVLPVLVWVVFAFRMKVRITFREIREAIAILNGFMQEHISGVRVVQLFRHEKTSAEGFHKRNLRYRDAYIKAIRYYALFFPMVGFLSAVAVALILLSGGLMIHQQALTWGALAAFLQYAERFFRPIRDLSERYNTMQAAMAAAERVFWVLDSKPEVADPVDNAATSSHVLLPPGSRGGLRGGNLTSPLPAKVRGEVAFENVSFEYKVGEPVLREVSFRVEPGQTLAVVGATGAGKTTLISLLMRFWDVTEGRITLDGRDIRSYRQEDLRRSFGVVLQDVFLFSGSVGENVTLGEPSRQGEALRKALEEANALEFVDALPKGVDEPVGERGATLSGGQKQLLAIARALAADPPLLLLDEATAAVDTETERRIQDALDRLMEGRTTIVVAHRLSTVRRADRIIVMHKGRIREEGTHEELLKLDGIYARLHRLQFAEGVAA